MSSGAGCSSQISEEDELALAPLSGYRRAAGQGVEGLSCKVKRQGYKRGWAGPGTGTRGLKHKVKNTPKKQFLNFISLALRPISPWGCSLGTVSRIEVRQFQPLAPGIPGQLNQGVSQQVQKSKCWHFRCGRRPAWPRVKHGLRQWVDRAPWSSPSRRSAIGQGQGQVLCRQPSS